MKGRTVLVLLALVAAVIGFGVWYALQDTAPPSDTGPAPETHVGTTEPEAAAPEKTEPRNRARAGATWVELGMGTVQGVVREYGTERPLADVTVTLSAGESGPNREIKVSTAADGSFRIAEVPNFDNWTLHVEAPAPLAPVEQSAVDVIENKVTDLGVLYVTPAFTVPGIVVDEHGEPIEGAEVRTLRLRTGGIQMDILRLIRELPVEQPSIDRATTGEDGKFRLEKTTAGTYDMKVLAKGREIHVERQVVVTPESEKRELRFVLRKGFQLEGRVVRKGEGTVANIPVVAFRQPRGETDFLALDRAYTRTDDDGKFALDGFGGGEYIVCATPPGEPFVVHDNVGIPGTSFLELVIEGDAWLEGRVTGKEGKPVAGAQVYVAHFDQRPVVGNARTDGDGHYVIRGLRSGKMQLFLVQAEDYATWPTDLLTAFTGRGDAGLELKPGRNERDVALEAGGIVRGVVLSKEDDKPLAGVRVELASILAMFGGSRSATTGADGKFEITSAPLGTSVLLLSKDGWFQPGMNPMSIAMSFQGGTAQKDAGKGYVISITEPGQEVERELTLARGSTLVGQVLTPEGDPVAGARVELKADDGDGMFGGLSALFGGSDPRMSDAEGRFEIAGPAPGSKARVTAKAPGYLEGKTEPMSAGVGQRVEGLVVKLRHGAKIEGRVRDERAQPIEGALIRALAKEGLNDWEIGWRLQQAEPTTTDAEGRYVLEHVEPGPVIVRVTHQTHVAQNFDGEATEEGKSLTLDATLTTGAALSGKVLGPDSKPWTGARVQIALQGQEGNDRFDDRSRNVTTDTDGAFKAEGLAPGTYDVHAEAKGAAPSETLTVVPSGQTVTLRLQPALRIGGTVRASGRPAAGVHVQVLRKSMRTNPETGEQQEVSEGVGNEQTDAEGKFLVEDLPAGMYDLHFEPVRWGNAERANVLEKDVKQVAAGNEAVLVELEPGLSIRGVVTLDDGNKAPNGWAHAQQVGDDGNPVADGANGWNSWSDGEFEIVGLPPGNYRLQVNVQGKGQRQLVVAAGGDPVRISLGGGATITGRVVDAEGNAVAGAWVNVQNEQGGGNGNTDSDGRYTIPGLPAGDYHVDVWSIGSGEQRQGRLDSVVVREREKVEAPVITVAKRE